MPNARPPKDIRFRDTSYKYMGTNVTIILIGIAAPIMVVARKFLRNRNKMITARTAPNRAVERRLPIAASMN